MKKLVMFGGVLALVMSAAFVQAASVEWVTGNVQFRVGSGAWQNVARGQNIPDSATVKTNAGARVKLNFSGGRTAIVEAGREASLSSLSGGSGAVSSIASRFGTQGASNGRVSSVAGTRASDAAQKPEPFTTLLDATVPGEAEVCAAAKDQWSTESNLNGAIETLSTFVADHADAYNARFLLGIAYVMNSSYADAARELAVVINATKLETPDMHVAYWNYMVALQGAGEFEAARDAAVEAINRYPSSETNTNLGRWHVMQAYSEFNLGNLDAAQAAVDEAARLAMSEVRLAYTSLTAAHGERGALQSATNVVSADPAALMIMEEQEYILDARRQLMAEIAARR